MLFCSLNYAQSVCENGEKRDNKWKKTLYYIINEKKQIKIVLTFKLLMIMKMEMYVAPELEVLEIMVEQGFAGSGDADFGPGNNEAI